MSILLVLGAFGFSLLAWPAAPVTMLAGTILAFGAGWGWTDLYHLAVVRLRPHTPAAASGAASTALFLGSIIGPLDSKFLLRRHPFGRHGLSQVRGYS
jgi:hypothetical protein